MMGVTPGSFLLDVGQALGWMLGMSVYLFLYVLVLMTPFVVACHVLRVLVRLAIRAGLLPRSRR
jgi:hypothetical protein